MAKYPDWYLVPPLTYWWTWYSWRGRGWFCPEGFPGRPRRAGGRTQPPAGSSQPDTNLFEADILPIRGLQCGCWIGISNNNSLVFLLEIKIFLKYLRMEKRIFLLFSLWEFFLNGLELAAHHRIRLYWPPASLWGWLHARVQSPARRRWSWWECRRGSPPRSPDLRSSTWRRTQSAPWIILILSD